MFAAVAEGMNEALVKTARTLTGQDKIDEFNRDTMIFNAVTVVAIATAIFTVVTFSILAFAISGILFVGRYHLGENLDSRMDTIKIHLSILRLQNSLKGGGLLEGSPFRRPIHIQLNSRL